MHLNSKIRVRAVILTVAAVLPVFAGSAFGRDPVVVAARDLVPNMRALEATDLRLETLSDGTVLLRLSATTWNSGEGPLELAAGEIDRGNGKQQVYQRVYAEDGSHRDVLAGSFAWHDAHAHFHFDDYALYTLQPIDAPGGSERLGSKTTFCIIDTDRIDRRLPGAPKRAVYTTCGQEVQGMSVGWGDTYKYYLAGQTIDVTGLPSGEYTLTIEVDPKNQLVEVDDTDNTASVRIRIDVAAGTVTIVGESSGPGNGNGRGGPPVR